MSRDRFSQRRREQGRRTAVRVGAGLGALALIGAGVWAVFFSTWLSAQKVSVQGTQSLTTEQVRQAAEVPMGTPLARLDLVSISGRVSKLALVESVEVSLSWPRTVSVKVVERTAVAWTRSGSQILLVDRYGVAYQPVRRKPKDVVEIRITADAPKRTQQALEESAAVIEQLRRSTPEIARQVRRVDAESKDDVVLVLSKNREVVWGSRDQGAKKAEVLTALLTIRASRYDVSAPEQPTTRQ